MLIDYASANNLPVTISNGSGVYSSNDKNFSSINQFKNKVLSTTAAADLEINSIALNSEDVRAGDLICMDTGSPYGTKDNAYSHIQVVVGKVGSHLGIRQGNFSKGSSKYNSLFYGGEKITNRAYDLETDKYINVQANTSVLNAKNAFGISFRRWNFMGM